MMNNRQGLTLIEILIAAGVLIILGIGGYYLLSKDEPRSEINVSEPTTTNSIPAPGFEDVGEMIVDDETMVDDSMVKEDTMVDEQPGAVKEITMTVKQWKFTPNRIEVNKGDTVRLTIQSIDVAHGISIPQFNVSTFLSPGNTTVVEFVASETGSFTFFCNVSCGSGHRGMTGTLIVN